MVLLFPFALYTITSALIYSNGTQLLLSWLSTSTSTPPFANEVQHETNSLEYNSRFILIIPGLNVPSFDIFYFFFAAILASIIHELGHALAANRHRLTIDNVGFSVFLCLPAVFVSIEHNQIDRKLFKRLEITATGLMNNAMLCLITLTLFWANPLNLLYKQINGLMVINVDSASSISNGPNALKPYDVIQRLNGQMVRSIDQWTEELHHIQSHQTGFCVPTQFITSYSFSTSCHNLEQCCDKIDTKHESRLCFMVDNPTRLGQFESNSNELECNITKRLYESNLNIYDAVNPDRLYSSCVPVRRVTDIATQFCNKTSDCMTNYHGRDWCIWPLELDDRRTRLVVLEVESETKPNILFWGPPIELYQAIDLSPVRGRFNFISERIIQHWNTMLRYIFTFSFTIMIINMLPFNPMDGFHLIDLSSKIMINDQRIRHRIVRLINLFALIIMVATGIIVTIQLGQLFH
ncbi:hypothetical protein RDWZM_009912 [Blomia tropicalis]|uniref:Membrane-bound transcription factor site-2 protease n=1 Tax=Blomia tropicalis TaxID=40697 RepID=A0A9Q0LZY2_BLOTA|nr:hypothetical protein RDWZM_009912 [Blomia tropicalis]